MVVVVEEEVEVECQVGKLSEVGGAGLRAVSRPGVWGSPRL